MKRFYLFLFLLLASLVFSSPVLAADSTSFDPTKVMVQSVGASIPVGTVITWPSNSWPSDRDNWLECNGQSISSAVYPELSLLRIFPNCPLNLYLPMFVPLLLKMPLNQIYGIK